MQYHLNGFKPGDPLDHRESCQLSDVHSERTLPEKVDVLIVGCGPAGLTLAAQLASFPTISTCIVENKDGPLERGQADGIACRTMEMFEAFGFAEKVLKEAYWVNETTFWKPSHNDPERISRQGRVQDTEDGLSEFPHVILNQARVHDFYLELMHKAQRPLIPYYSRQLLDLNIDKTKDYSATAILQNHRKDKVETINARYVVGCDGARSAVRKNIGLELRGDSANHAWGVMDALLVTDFPDIRFKSLIQSSKEGSIIIIPREGGYLVRLYIELDKLHKNERIAQRDINLDHLIAAATTIFKPYSVDIKEVPWWSVYEIGQRLCNKFDDLPVEFDPAVIPSVFIAGDACHTHSPKAGQGMNVSMRDSFNLGWKLAMVLTGRCDATLLHSYSAERQAVATELISFDREWAKIIGSRDNAILVEPSESELYGNEQSGNEQSGHTLAKLTEAEVNSANDEFQRYFVKHARYTAGTSIEYKPSQFIGHSKNKAKATGFDVGRRFHSAPVITVSDAKPVQLGSTVKADGRFRFFAFAGQGDRGERGRAIANLCEFLSASLDSPIVRFTPKAADIDSVFDVRVIFQQVHTDIDLQAMPGLLLPAKGCYGLLDYEKIFCTGLSTEGGSSSIVAGDIFEMRGIDREQGVLVVVRPDQHIAQILSLDAFDELSSYFGAFMLDQ